MSALGVDGIPVVCLSCVGQSCSEEAGGLLLIDFLDSYSLSSL